VRCGGSGPAGPQIETRDEHPTLDDAFYGSADYSFGFVWEMDVSFFVVPSFLVR
jgi:hypothetical protein